MPAKPFLLGCLMLAVPAWGQTAGDLATKYLQRTTLRARFVAEANTGCEGWLGSFLGGCQLFILEVDNQHRLIKISYQFREKHEQIPDSTLDYSSVRSFELVRDVSCDESVSDMATVKGREPTGRIVVIGQSPLRMARHAPNLKPSTGVLPCYVLESEDLKQDSSRHGHANVKGGGAASVGLLSQRRNRSTFKFDYVKLKGRVLAEATMFPLGALDWKYVTFVFGVEEDKGGRVSPVKVSYAFSKADGPPPDSFFDYSKWYELQAIREPQCDESVSSLSYVKNVDAESGTELPPSYVLQYLDGAPQDVLKPDAVLLCYTLYAGHYRVVGRSSR